MRCSGVLYLSPDEVRSLDHFFVEIHRIIIVVIAVLLLVLVLLLLGVVLVVKLVLVVLWVVGL